MANKNDVKKNHHYVSRKHLKNWSRDNKQIWRTTQTGKVDLYGIAGVANEHYFYSIKEIKESDLDKIKGILIPLIPEPLKYTLVPTIEKLVNLALHINTLDNNSKERKILENNFMEDTYTKHENIFNKISDSIISNNTLPDNKYDRHNLLIFSCMQHTKTKPTKDNIINIFPNYKDLNKYPEILDFMIRLWWLISYIISFVLAFNLMDKYNFSLLLNLSKKEFIISDAGITNIHPSVFREDKSLPPTGIVLYYPLSPKHALQISKQGENSTLIVDEDRVEELNKLVKSNIHTTLFASSQKTLIDLMTHNRHTKDLK